SRQISGKQSERCQGRDDPAVGAILAHSGTQISAGKDRRAGDAKESDGERGERRIGEKGGKSARAKNGEAEIGGGAGKDKGQAEDEHFYCSFSTVLQLRFSDC